MVLINMAFLPSVVPLCFAALLCHPGGVTHCDFPAGRGDRSSVSACSIR